MSGIVSKNGGRGSGIVGVGTIGADAVGGSNIADDAIDSEHYTDGSIDNAHIADDAIDSEHYAAGSIDEAHIADNAVTLAKMAGGTDGNIISYDAAGDPVAIATGNDGQVLTSAGAGAPPAFETAAAGGAWTLIGTNLMDGASQVTQTGLSASYDAYCIIWSDVTSNTGDGSRIQMRFGDASGVDSGSTDYSTHYDNQLTGAGAVSFSASTGDDYVRLSETGIGNATGESSSGIMWVLYPSDATGRILCSYQTTYMGTTNVSRGGYGVGERLLNGFAIDRVDLSISSGDMDGRFTVWGISHG